MTSLHQQRAARHFRAQNDRAGEQRDHRRYDLGGQTLMVNRWDTARRTAQPLGYLMDLSAGGVRVRTEWNEVCQRGVAAVGGLETPIAPRPKGTQEYRQ